MFDEETLEKVTMEMLQNLAYECINGYELQREDFSKVLLEEDEKLKESWLVLTNVVYKVNSLLIDTLGLKVPEKM